MSRHRDDAFVLRTRVLGESDLIVSLLTESQGMVRGVARSARRSRRRFGGALEPMTRVRADWLELDGRDLHRVEALEAVRSHAPMQSDPAIQAVCACVCEILEAVAAPGQPDPATFRLLAAVLDALDRGAEPLASLRYFELWMLRLHGLFPDLEACGACERGLEPDASARVSRSGALLCERCAAACGEPVASLVAADRRFLEAALRTAPAGIALPASGRALEHLLRGRLETFAERRFRAYRHLAPGAGRGPREGGER